jgi:ABC-type nickel/cobalt efflux system permease component RcnA
MDKLGGAIVFTLGGIGMCWGACQSIMVIWRNSTFDVFEKLIFISSMGIVFSFAIFMIGFFWKRVFSDKKHKRADSGPFNIHEALTDPQRVDSGPLNTHEALTDPRICQSCGVPVYTPNKCVYCGYSSGNDSR